MAFISIGKLDKNQISIIIGCVFSFLHRLLNQYEGTKLLKNQILTNICISISRFLTVFPYIILKIKDSQVDKNHIENNSRETKKLIFVDYKRKNVRGKWRYMLLSAVTYLLQSIFLVCSFEIKTNAWIWNILFSSIFQS